MQALKAQVKNGRLVLDEPTDLPEGEVVELIPIDDVLAIGGDYEGRTAHRCRPSPCRAPCPSMNLRLAPRALSEAKRKKTWWLKSRLASPGLFEEEFSHVVLDAQHLYFFDFHPDGQSDLMRVNVD